MANAADYIDDVRIYAADASEDTVGKIVKHLGIALAGDNPNADSKLVSCSDPSELERVREQWLKKKLALTDADADLDASISAVCTAMSADRTKRARHLLLPACRPLRKTRKPVNRSSPIKKKGQVARPGPFAFRVCVVPRNTKPQTHPNRRKTDEDRGSRGIT